MIRITVNTGNGFLRLIDTSSGTYNGSVYGHNATQVIKDDFYFINSTSNSVISTTQETSCTYISSSDTQVLSLNNSVSNVYFLTELVAEPKIVHVPYEIVYPPYINRISSNESNRIEQERLASERFNREVLQTNKLNAQEKAKQLLIENLNNSQRLQYTKFGYFYVTGQSGKRYQITKGKNINIYVLENKRIVTRLCAHPRIDCPIEDTMLIQKIMLESNEKHFLSIAKEWRL